MERVTILSETQQAFMGTTYYLCGFYFQNKGRRLHRAVWEHCNGKIPDGCHVHHIDGDRSNNQIENLSLLPRLEHIRQHAQEPERRDNGRRAIVLAIQAAPEWHGSDDGRKWHSEHAKEYWANAPMNEYICDMCGKTYKTRAVRHKGHHFCGGNCKARYGRRKKAGLL